MIGRTLSHYRIEEAIGSGGMGTVYRARDLHLERDVALKVLPEGLLADDHARQRFRREALALSRLQHPHINVVHDFDVQDGVQFLVMELVPGMTLAEKLAQGPLPEAEVVRLGLEIAAALEAAHEAGVLHRDLKPGNIMATPRGEAKVLDFGLAKRFGAASELSSTVTMTGTGILTGTLPYMAPEQLLGQEVDARTDLYALGAVLYEMATARRPHTETQEFALANAILHHDAPALRSVRAELSAALEAIVLKCLARDPAGRYGSAGALIEDLRAGAPAATADAGRRRRSGSSALAKNVFVVLLAGVGVVLLTRLLAPGRDTVRSLVVLPLENLSGDPQQAYFADGITDELTTTLAQVRGLNVISRNSARLAWESRKPLRQIARELGVQAALEGAVRRVGDQVRISARLVDARTERQLWAQTFQRNLHDVLALQSEVALAIAERIRLSLAPEVESRLKARPKVDPQAHEAYLKGRYYVNQNTGEAGKRAIEFFRGAIELDPGYAAAYAGLADAYWQLSSLWLPPAESMSRARAAATKAIELDPNLSSAHTSLATVRGFYDWEWADAEEGLRHAISLNSNDVMAHQQYGYLLTVNRRFDEAEREFERAHEIDPLSALLSFMRLMPLNLSRQYHRAIAEGLKTVNDFPSLSLAHGILGQAYFFGGDRQRGLEEFRKGYAKDPHVAFLAWEGHARALSGDRRGALEMLRRLEAAAETVYVQPNHFALIHAGLGQKDEAFDWLRKGVQQHSEELAFLQVDPGMDPLRSDPRFGELLKQVGFGH